MKRVFRRLVLCRRSQIPLLRKIMRKNMRRKAQIPILHIHLADHCNLNCRGCDNLSPLAPKTFADTGVVERDCARIAHLSGGRVQEVQLLGGEPLLHSQAAVFAAIARKYFPAAPVKIITNGVLLLRQTDEFWESCRQNRIQIVVTKYPIRLDHDALERHVRRQGVAFEFYGRTRSVPKTMQCSPLDLSGSQDARDSFLRCNSANRCCALDNGRIYTCSLVPYIKYFNAYFGRNLAVTPDDYMDIYKAQSIDEILHFLSTPKPFCRYCNRKGTIWDIGYGISQKDITEWIGCANQNHQPGN